VGWWELFRGCRRFFFFLDMHCVGFGDIVQVEVDCVCLFVPRSMI